MQSITITQNTRAGTSGNLILKVKARTIQEKKPRHPRQPRVRQPRQLFSWEGFEKEQQTLIQAAIKFRNFSDTCNYDDTTFFARCALSYRNNSQNNNDNVAGECLRTIHDLQYTLVHVHNLNWNFVYKEWSLILNPNEFQRDLVDNLVKKDKKKYDY